MNYDKSEFSGLSALSSDDSKLESIYNNLYSLKAFLDPKNYKSYDELKARLNKVLGTSAVMTTAESISIDKVDNSSYSAPSYTPSESEEEEDDTLSYFQKLANA